MMTFLNSIILTLSFAILIPILIHLFNRQKKTKKSFSSLRFLKMLEKQRLNRINIYQYLLIIIRTIIIGLLILAFARPTLVTDITSNTNGARTTAIIIIDTGFNMRYYDEKGMRFDRAREVLKKVVNLYQPDDQVFVLLSHQPQIIESDSLTIDNINCSFSKADWISVANETVKIFESHNNFNQEVIVISDNISSTAFFSSIKDQIQKTRFYSIQAGDRTFNNVGVDSVYFINNLFEPLQPIDLEVSLYKTGINNGENTEIHLYVNDKREAYSQASIAPESKTTVPLTFQPREFGYIHGYIEISEDALENDNRYYFSLNIPEEVDILFVDQKSSVYLESALKAIDLNSNVNIKFSSYESWGIDNFSRYHKIFLSNFSSIEDVLISRLIDYLNTGGRIILMPGFNSIPTDINYLLNKLNSDIRVVDLASTNDPKSYFKLTLPSKGHPIIGNLFRKNDINIDSPHFSKYFQVRKSTKYNRLLSFSNNDPFLLNDKIHNGNIYLFTSYIDESWTDIQFKGIFIPLLTRILSSDNHGFEHGTNGAKVNSKFEHVLSPSDKVGRYSLKTPDNMIINLIPELSGRKHVLKLNHFNRPGIYTIFNEAQTVSLVSVNISSSNMLSQIIEMDNQKGDNLPMVFKEDEDFGNKIVEARSGYELWKFFILLIIVFILMELILIKKIEK